MRLEPKPAPSLAATLLYPAGAIVATLVVAALLDPRWLVEVELDAVLRG